MHILGYILIVGQLSTSIVESCLRAESPNGCCKCTSFPETYHCPGSCRAGSYMADEDIPVTVCGIFSYAPTQRRRTDDESGTTAVSLYMDNCTTDSTDGSKVVTCLPCYFRCLTCRGGGENDCTSCTSGFKLSKTATDQGECVYDSLKTADIIIAVFVPMFVLVTCVLLVCINDCCKNYCSWYRSMCGACSRCLAVCSDGCTKRCGQCAPGTCLCMKQGVRVEQLRLQEQAANDDAIELTPLPGAPLQTDVHLEGRRHSSADVEINMEAESDDNTEPKLLRDLSPGKEITRGADVDENTEPKLLRGLPSADFDETTEPKLCDLPPTTKARTNRLRRFQEEHFDFDIFVSYDREDENWVREHLMPEMEERLGLKLCIHDRDFRLGKEIIANIYECMKASKKVMLIFSTNFADSEWCQFELTLGQRHVMDFRDTLVIVVLEDIPDDVLTTRMKAVMETTTYIKWPDKTEDRDTFWQRLRDNFIDIMPQA